MPRGLYELRERRDGKSAKARVSLEKASEKMALELCLEQIFPYGDGEDIEADGHRLRPGVSTVKFGGHDIRVGGQSRSHNEGSQHHDL